MKTQQNAKKQKVSRKKFLTLTFLVLTCLWIPLLALAIWPDDPTVNVPVCTDLDNQSWPASASDGSGGAIVVWEDTRNGYPDIYAQRVDDSGEVQWTENGVAICTAPSYQYKPTIASDGSGGAFITWYDKRNSTIDDNPITPNYDIYAQRVNASGVVQWTENGVAICTAPNAQKYPTIVRGGLGGGGAIITWEDERDYDNKVSDIYAQCVNTSGEIQWTPNGVPICTASQAQRKPQIAGDISFGAYITWYDNRDFNYDIYARYVDAWGFPYSMEPICTASYAQYEPTIAWDGAAGVIIAWSDDRDNNDKKYDIYAQRMDTMGVRWIANGVPVCTAEDNQEHPRIVTCGCSGGAIITWEDKRAGNYDIYAQRMYAGESQWTPDGVAICTVSNNQGSPALTSDSSGGAIITWYENRGTTHYDIYAQRVSVCGAVQWTPDGVAISTAPSAQQYPTIVSDDSGGTIIAWEDWRNGNFDIQQNSDIYTQGVFSDGSLGIAPIFHPGDLSGDGSVTAFDASLILQFVVGLIQTFPVEDMMSSSPDNVPLRHYEVSVPSLNVTQEQRITVPIQINDATGLLAGGISLKYDTTVLKATGASLKLNGAYWQANTELDGEVRVAFAKTDFSHSEGQILFVVEFDVLPDTEGKTSPLSLDGVQLAESLSIKKINGLVTVLPSEFRLHQNYPNPFNPETWIPFKLSDDTDVVISIYDVEGKLIRNIGLGKVPAGMYISKDKAVYWDGCNDTGEKVSSGLYFYTLQAGEYSATKRMLIVK